MQQQTPPPDQVLKEQAHTFWRDLVDLLDVKQLTTLVITFLPKLVAAALIFLLFLVISRVSRRVLRKVMEGAGVQPALVLLLVDNIYKYALMIVAIVMAADQLGINVAAAVAGLGIAGIAVGFAAQDSVANVISGIIIFWDKPFVVGDWLQVDGQFGCVSDITLRSTRIRTPRNTYVVFPNKVIVDTVLENLSKRGELRIDLPIGIAYKEDTHEARRVLLDAAREVDLVMPEPAPDVVLTELGDSSVNLLLRVWVEHAKDQQQVTFAMLEAGKRALDTAGIQIPFPHVQLFVDDVEPRVWERAERLVR